MDRDCTVLKVDMTCCKFVGRKSQDSAVWVFIDSISPLWLFKELPMPFPFFTLYECLDSPF